ncbi:hypothetical protein [Phyllobacterium chamaecytisi]|uniref:hypothetical protein n=1 Tax=Phyllobacterium chamaecytisi TaxID=2876082 RepID=UPI001CCAA167|nr:hypothetical protein [Phyllobacterium sp. KW56]MBZ9605563.1 hypothetical protein [Phyllobacterium sp. KW56]
MLVGRDMRPPVISAFSVLRDESDGSMAWNRPPCSETRRRLALLIRNPLMRRVCEQDDITMPELAAELADRCTVDAPLADYVNRKLNAWIMRKYKRFRLTKLGRRSSCGSFTELGGTFSYIGRRSERTHLPDGSESRGSRIVLREAGK